MPNATASPPRVKSRALGYLFFMLGGAFGAHRLYHGKPLSAGAQLGLFCAGLALIEGRSTFPGGLFIYSAPLTLLGFWLLADFFMMLAWSRPSNPQPPSDQPG